MKFWVTYPLNSHRDDPTFAAGETVAGFARAAEAAGFDGVGFTDHPAPTERWLRAGGHDALDPFAALSFVAAVTQHLHLIPNICVLPYRNPFLVAKSAATIAALSAGRFILAVGTGYLRGEFRALGVDPDERNELFDEALHVLSGAWSRDDFAFEGLHFTAAGQTCYPQPAPPVPIWIGGNSARSRQRVVDSGDGWNPFVASAAVASTTRTPPLETADDLATLLDDLWRRAAAAGRDPGTIDVAFSTTAGGSPADDDFDTDAHRAELDRLAGLGVTWVSVPVPGDSPALAMEALARYGEQVIGRDGRGTAPATSALVG